MSERLRIAMFSDSALPILNGVSLSIDALIRELRRQGHSVHLFTAAYPHHRETDPNIVRMRALTTPWTPDYPLALPPFLRPLREFRKHEFDVVHTHTPFTIGFVGLRWAESHEIPIVSTYHTLYDRYAHYIPYFPKRYVRFKIAKHTNFYYNSVDRVICPSKAAMRWLLRHAVHRPIDVIPTGCFDRKMLERAECRRALGIAPDERVLLYVGRLAREKNLDMLFEMARIVFKKDPYSVLYLVGDGPYRDECLRSANRLGIGDRVRFAGFVPREDVDEYYAAADLFVFPSMTETQGLVVQEAMAYGLPAIVVVGGGAGEGVVDGENGFLVRNEAQAFADRTLEVLSDDRIAASLSANAIRSVQDRTAGAMAQRVSDVYRRAISEHGVETALPQGTAKWL